MSYEIQLFSKAHYAQAAEIAPLLHTASIIGIVSHANPDADALGSTLALAHGLISLGKTVYIGNASPIPDYLRWMDYTGPLLQTFPQGEDAPQVVVILDCGDAQRLGDMQEHALSYPTINIDHHLENPHFASEYNWADSTMAATGQMIAALLHAMNVPLTGAIARSLYTAISSDTGNLTYGNTNEDVFLLCANLLRLGLEITPLRKELDNTWRLERMHLWGKLMSRLKLERENSVALACVSLADLQSCQAKKEDLEGFSEHLRRLQGVHIAGFVREDTAEQCKVSLRSSGPIDVREILAALGGGGHKNASGATVHLSLQKSYELVLQSIRTWLNDNNY